MYGSSRRDCAINRIIKQASRVGKPLGLPLSRVKQARFWSERGCHFFTHIGGALMVQQQVRVVLEAMWEGSELS